MTGAGPAGAVPVDDHQPRAVDAAAQYSTRERGAPPRADRLAERALGVGGGPSVLVAVHHPAKVPGSAPDRDTDCPPDVRRLIPRAEVRSAPSPIRGRSSGTVASNPATGSARKPARRSSYGLP